MLCRYDIVLSPQWAYVELNMGLSGKFTGLGFAEYCTQCCDIRGSIDEKHVNLCCILETRCKVLEERWGYQEVATHAAAHSQNNVRPVQCLAFKNTNKSINSFFNRHLSPNFLACLGCRGVGLWFGLFCWVVWFLS